MRLFRNIVLLVLAAATFASLLGGAYACLTAADNAYTASGQWFDRAAYVGQCVPRPVAPTTAGECFELSHSTILKSPNGVKLPEGFAPTDKDVLLAGVSSMNNTGAALIALAGGIVALIGVVIALGSLLFVRQRG